MRAKRQPASVVRCNELAGRNAVGNSIYQKWYITCVAGKKPGVSEFDLLSDGSKDLQRFQTHIK